MIVNELITKIGFMGSILPLQKYNASYTTSVGLIAKGITATQAAAGAMLAFVAVTLKGVDSLGQLSREAGISAETLQEYGYAASVSGSSIEAVKVSVAGLSKRIGEAANGTGEGVVAFDRLGISLKDSSGKIKSTEAILAEMNKTFSTLSKSEQFAMSEKLGIDRTMLQTLNLTSEQLDELRLKARKLGIVSNDDVEKVIEFNDMITTLKFSMDALRQKVAIGLIPYMRQVSASFEDFLLANAELIKNGLTKFITIAGGVVSAVINVGKAIYGTIGFFVGMENALYAVGLAAIYFGKALLLNPMTLVVAAVSAVVLAIDDLYVAFEGGESVIQKFFASFDINIVDTLKIAFIGLKNIMLGMIKVPLTIAESFLALNSIIAQTVKALTFGKIDLTGGATKALNDLRDYRTEINKSIDANKQEMANLKVTYDKQPLTDKSIAQTQAISNNTSNQSINNKIDIKVVTDDPQTAGQSVIRAQQREIKNAIAQTKEQGR